MTSPEDLPPDCQSSSSRIADNSVRRSLSMMYFGMVDVAKCFALPFTATGQAITVPFTRCEVVSSTEHRDYATHAVGSLALISLGSQELVVCRRGRRLYIIKQQRAETSSWTALVFERCLLDAKSIQQHTLTVSRNICLWLLSFRIVNVLQCTRCFNVISGCERMSQSLKDYMQAITDTSTS